MRKVNYFFATFFYSGYFPFAPGSFASFLSGLVGCLFLIKFGAWYLAIFLLFLTIIGFYVSGKVAQYEGKEDPAIVVIDEAVGILLSMLIVSLYYKGYSLNFFLSFVFFRFFDIFKIFPVNVMERIKGGSGIMLDDIVAGLMSAVAVLIIIFLAGKYI